METPGADRQGDRSGIRDLRRMGPLGQPAGHVAVLRSVHARGAPARRHGAGGIVVLHRRADVRSAHAGGCTRNAVTELAECYPPSPRSGRGRLMPVYPAMAVAGSLGVVVLELAVFRTGLMRQRAY